MITIKAMPYDLHPDSSESYGPEYQVRVSQKAAKELAGMFPLPGMGEEICIAIPRLMLANISGTFYVRHTNVPVRDWPTVFQIKVVPLKERGVV